MNDRPKDNQASVASTAALALGFATVALVSGMSVPKSRAQGGPSCMGSVYTNPNTGQWICVFDYGWQCNTCS